MKNFKNFASLFLIFIFLLSCSNKKDSKLEYLGDIHIEKIKEIQVGEAADIDFTFISALIDKDGIQWESKNPEIASINTNPDKSCRVMGVTAGETLIKLSAENNSIERECVLIVTKPDVPEPDGIIRILAIGNSFSEDAIETHLYDLAAADGRTIIIGNLYIPGCTLETHLNNAKGDKNAYNYRKVNKNGLHTSENDWSISKAIADENWDYISFQQESSNSGIFSTYEASLPELFDYVKKLNKSTAKYILHQTWAYANTTGHSGFQKYDNDQMKMYNAIVDAVYKAKDLVGVDIVIPSGTAIQNARTSVFEDNLNVADGYHLARPIGRFTAACTWYGTLFETDVTKNTYKPDGLSDYHAEIIKVAAQKAVQSPKSITDLVDYKTEPEESEEPNNFNLEFPIYISFNIPDNENIPSPFQNFKGSNYVLKFENLKDDKGNNTKFAIESTVPFGGQNNLGELESSIDWIPNIVSKYAFFGSGSKVAKFTISRLNPDDEYIFEFFSSRQGTPSASDIRETEYRLLGSNNSSVCLDALGNNSKTAISGPIKANTNGTIILEVSASSNNNNSSKYFYINALRIMPAKK